MTAPTPSLSPEETGRWTRIGLLAALAMALSYLETFIPIPIPGVKLGLANIPVLIALARRDASGAFYVGALKVLSLGLLFGNPLSMAYSLVGTLLAFAVMAPLSRVRGLRLELVSVCGAMAHEVGQLAVAMALLGTPLVWYSAPALLIAGAATGCVCGMVAQRALALAEGDEPEGAVAGAKVDRLADIPASDGLLRGASASSSLARPLIDVDARVVLAAFALFTIAALHASSWPVLGALFGASCLAALVGRVRISTLARALAPTAAILVITFVAQVASLQTGTVIASLGPIALTREAVEQTGIMTARLVVVMLASVAVMSLAQPTDLVSALSWMLSPLRRLGVRTDGPIYALEVALAAVPALIEMARTTRRDWRDWRRDFPAFIARALG